MIRGLGRVAQPSFLVCESQETWCEGPGGRRTFPTLTVMPAWSPSFLARIAAVLLLSGCAALKSKPSAAPTESPNGTDPGISSLLSMSYGEASSIAAQHMEVTTLPKVAADNIEVLSKTKDGKPRKVRAKGRVFIQLDNLDGAHALCDEALVSDDEVILRGRPVLQRGGSTVEGLSDVTVFYVFGSRLKVIGRHRLTNLDQLTGESPWKAGSASLLPPLDSADVPEAVREEMRKAAEAEAQLQRSRVGLPAAFPELPLPPAVPVVPEEKPKNSPPVKAE